MPHSNIVYRIADRALRVGLRLAPPSLRSESAALWWGHRFQPRAETIRLRSGALIAVSDIEHSQLLMRYLGTFEPHCLAHLRKYAVPGSTILDVGANIGLYTIEGSRAVGPKGKVISIEAMPTHAESIERSVRLNGMNNVFVINVAVGSEPGEACLTCPSGGNQGMFTLGKVNGNETYEVPVKRIDDILVEQNITSVSFIKMDIEGSELLALRGASDILKQCRPPLLIELNETALNACGATSGEVKDILFALGYRGWVVGRNGLSQIVAETQHDCDECLFLSQ